MRGSRPRPGACSHEGPMASADKKPFNPARFFREVRQEGERVTWTSRKETIITTIMVFIMVVLAALFFLAVDFVLSNIVRGGISLLIGGGADGG